MLLKRHGFEQHLYFWRSKACNFARIYQTINVVGYFSKTGQLPLVLIKIVWKLKFVTQENSNTYGAHKDT